MSNVLSISALTPKVSAWPSTFHTGRMNAAGEKGTFIFYCGSTTEIRCFLQPLKQNPELVLLDSIAAAVESQTIITCEQLRNIPKNIKRARGRGEND